MGASSAKLPASRNFPYQNCLQNACESCVKYAYNAREIHNKLIILTSLTQLDTSKIISTIRGTIIGLPLIMD